MSELAINDLIRWAAIKYLTTDPIPPPEKTLAEFEVHVAERGTNGEYGWGNGVYRGEDLSFYATVGPIPDPPFDTLGGSPWEYVFGAAEPTGRLPIMARITQHCLPTDVPLSSLNDTPVFMRTAYRGAQTLEPRTRNGFTSSGYAVAEDVASVEEFLFYDPVRGPMKMQPYLGLGPEPYDW